VLAAILNGAYAPLAIFFAVLALAAFVVEVWALVDAIRRPAGAFTAAGKQTKKIWLLILGVATVIGLAGATGYAGVGITNILAVAAFVAAAIYHVDVRPKIREVGGGRSRKNIHQGPYGPW
jgi:hypothetical protein